MNILMKRMILSEVAVSGCSFLSSSCASQFSGLSWLALIRLSLSLLSLSLSLSLYPLWNRCLC